MIMCDLDPFPKSSQGYAPYIIAVQGLTGTGRYSDPSTSVSIITPKAGN